MILLFVVKVDPADPTNHYDGYMAGVPRPPEFAPPRLSEKDALAALSAMSKVEKPSCSSRCSSDTAIIISSSMISTW